MKRLKIVGLSVILACALMAMVVAALSTLPIPQAAARAADHIPLDRSEAVLLGDDLASIGNQAGGVRLLASDARGVTLELYTPDVQVMQEATDGEACQRLVVKGYGETESAGQPALPVQGAMVGIPAGSAVTLTVLETQATTLPGRYALCPAPSPIVETQLAGEITYRGTASIKNASAYARAAFSPTLPAELVSTGFIRSQRVAQIRFYPFRYNPVSAEVQQLQRIRVRLEFEPDASPKLPVDATTDVIDEGPFEDTLRHVVINYDVARAWRANPRLTPAANNAVAMSQPAYKILVDMDGIYQVTYSDLQAAGADVSSLDPRTFRLFNQGRESAIYVTGENDGSFDAGDVLIFYGRRVNTRYTMTNVYWLTWGGANGLRMAALDGTSGTAPTPDYFLTVQRVERDLYYQSLRPSGPDNDYWYWNYIYSTGSPVSAQYTTTLRHLATAPLSATVRGLFKGYDANPSHHTQVYLNGRLIDEAIWATQTEYAFEVNVPQSFLLEGTNTISVVCGINNSQDIIFVNWFEIAYHATYTARDDALFFSGQPAGVWKYKVGGFTTPALDVFNITSPAQPARILSATVQAGSGVYTLTFQQTISDVQRYLALSPAQRRSPLRIERDAPSNLYSGNNGADYIIITHGNFYTAVLPLAAHRSAQGRRVVVVNAQDIYDEFNYGVFDPAAIQAFLAYAYAAWTPPAPAFVILVGDGNYDFKNNLGRNEPNYIPPYLAHVDPWMGETAADNRYVCVSGSDILPDMHLGRLPVKTVAEANTVIAKILAYEQNPPSGDWNKQTLFVADNADSAGDFAALSDAIADYYLPAPYTAQKVYYKVTHSTVSAARTALLGAINSGRLLVNYVGHGSVPSWASEQLLKLADVASLTNGGRLPFFVPMTCYEGYFIFPSPPGQDYSSLGETLVRAADKGAIASWSPTGLGVASGHDYLNRALYTALFFDDVIQLGPATTYAKYYLYANSGGHRELLDTYILFGDPALRLNVPKTDVSIAKSVNPSDPVRPGSLITYTLTCSNTGPTTAHHIVITDALPAALLNPVVSSSTVITPRAGSQFVWDAPDLPAGQTHTITIRATIDPAFIGALTNTASIATSAVETTTVNNVTAPVVTTLIYPDLAISKQGPAQARPGSAVTYTLVYSNVGQALAEQIVITDILPAGLMPSTAAYMWSGVPVTPRGGAPFVWDAPQLAVGQRGVITVTAMISPTFIGALSNSAQIANAIAEPNTANNVAGPVLTQMIYPDLAISKQGPAQARPGERITYTLAYTNVGAAAADTVVITDELSGLLQDAAYTSVGAPLALRPASRFVWETPVLAAGQGGVITITATIAPTFTGVLTNTARIAGAIVETSTSNNISGPILTEMLTPDLEIHKAGPANSRSGDVITYTLTYINNGTAPASQVVITDLVPSALQSVTFAYSGAPLAPRGGDPYVWDVSGALETGQGGVITISAVISPGFAGMLTNAAVIGGAQVEKDTANNISERIVTGVDMPDLVIAKWGPPYALAGSRLTYTLAYSNEGLAVASQVVITDLVPSELLSVTFDASDPGLTPRPGAPFGWDVGDLAPGAGGVITISGVLSPTLSGVISNTAYITTPTFERDVNNVAGPIVTRVGVPDLEIRKQGPALVLVGSPVTYTLFYSNVGVADAAQVVISDIIPVELTNVQVTFSGAAIAPRAGTAFVWDVVPAIPPGAGGVITISGILTPSFAGELVNVAQIATATSEWNLANNETEPVSTYVGLPDLAIHKQGPTEALVGSRITYTLAFSNVGSFAASGVVITDALPSMLTDVDVDASGAAIAPRAGMAFVWDVVSAMPPGAGGVITISGVLTPSFAGELVNTAQIATATPEWNLANNETSAVSTRVGWPDLAIRKHAPDRVWSGSSITWTLAFSNAGAVTASNVVISDALPAQLTNISVSSTGVPLALRPGSRLAWDIAELAAGQGGVITITATVPPTFEGELVNTAYISAATPESATSNNIAGPLVTQAGLADVMIRKWGPPEALSGSYITYTLAYSNVGSFAAENVVIADALPLGLTPVSVITSGAVIIPRPGRTFVWDAAELAPLEGGLITITARVAPTLTGQIINWGHISSASPDRNDANNRAGPVTTQVGLPDVAISKSGPAETQGGVITYTLVYSNIGSMVAHGVVISDILPPALVSPTVAFSGPVPLLRAGSRLVWEVGDLAVGQSGVITITAWIESAFGQTLDNVAAIATVDPEADWANNTASVATFVWYRYYCPLVAKNYRHYRE